MYPKMKEMELLITLWECANNMIIYVAYLMYRIKDLLVTSYMEWGYYVRAEHVVYDKNNSVTCWPQI